MNQQCLEKKMRNVRGVQKPQGKNIHKLDALLACMPREKEWFATVKEDGVSYMIDVDVSTKRVRAYLTTSGTEIKLAPCLHAAVLQQFVRIDFTGTVYCELASTFKSNDDQHGFDKANMFSNRTKTAIRLEEFRAQGCRLVALYTDDMDSGIPSASKRLRPLKELPRITTDVETGIVVWPDEIVVCVEILAVKATPEEVIDEIRQWQFLSTKPGATRREGVVLMPDEGRLVNFGMVDKTNANYRNKFWFKVKEQYNAEACLVTGFNKKTNSAQISVTNTPEYATGTWKLWSVPLNYVDKSWIINMLAAAAFDNDDTSDDDKDVQRPTYLSMGCAIRWYVGHVAVRCFVIFSLKKIGGKEQIPFAMSPVHPFAGKRAASPAAGGSYKRVAPPAAGGSFKRLSPPPPANRDVGSAAKDAPVPMGAVPEKITVKGVCPVCNVTVYSNCQRMIIKCAYHHVHCGNQKKIWLVDGGCACGTCPVRQPVVDNRVIVID